MFVDEKILNKIKKQLTNYNKSISEFDPNDIRALLHGYETILNICVISVNIPEAVEGEY